MSVKLHEAYCLDSQQDRLLWFDDFLGDQIQDEWSNAGAGGVAVIDQQTSGICRLTTGALTGNNHYFAWGNIKTLLVTKKVSMECRVKLSSVANIESLLMLYLDWNNLVRFGFDTNVGVNWYTRCRSGGVATDSDTGIVADTNYHIFRIECHTHDGTNHVHFYIDGTETNNSPVTTNVPVIYLQIELYLNTREDAIKSMDIDYCVVRQEI